MMYDKQSFLEGLAAGLCGRGVGVFASSYMYGDYPSALPKIPEVEGYPYSVIEHYNPESVMAGTHVASLYCFNEPVTLKETDRVIAGITITNRSYINEGEYVCFLLCDNMEHVENLAVMGMFGDIEQITEPNTWTRIVDGKYHSGTGYGRSISDNSKVVWTNHDIIKQADGTTVYKAKTEPAAVWG